MNIKLILIGLLLVLFSTQVFALSNAKLVAYYKFDETSGNGADATANARTMTNINTATYGAGKINNSVILNGSNQYLTNSSFPTTHNNGFSFAAWVKATDYTPDSFKSILWQKESGSFGQITLVIRPTGVIEMSVGNGLASVKARTTTTLTNGTWYHVVGTVLNNGDVKIYLNGNLEDTAAYAGIMANLTSKILIGASETQEGSIKSYFDGQIDEVAIFDRELTQQDITDLYNGDKGLTYPFESVSFTYNINKSEAKIYLTDTSTFPVITDWNWLVDGLSISTDQNTSFSVVSNTDYNVCLIINTGEYSYCSTINSGILFGRGFFKMYDSANNELDGVGYSINPALNGVSSGVLTDNNLDLNLQAITSQNYTFTFTKSDYTTLSFTLPLTQYTDLSKE